ncbi:MAG TPA: MFS transporter, partial [Acetobacteraceae bacterium]|nr:MFS transporter [Acetobacteraceae bacterium]
PVIVSWIASAHQLGGALAALGAGEVRSITGSYVLAFAGSGALCFIASVLVLRIGRRAAGVVAA